MLMKETVRHGPSVKKRTTTDVIRKLN